MILALIILGLSWILFLLQGFVDDRKANREINVLRNSHGSLFITDGLTYLRLKELEENE